MRLEDLGGRICILGPSSGGKSTLAAAIARANGSAVVHLDQLHHQPGTDWRPRSDAEFAMLHQAAIDAESWVIDGNYSRHLPARLQRATGVISIESRPLGNLVRYLRRSLSAKGQRIGAPEGAPDRIKWEMIRYILWDQVRKRGPLDQFENDAGARPGGLTVLRLRSMRDVKACYEKWALRR